MPTRQLIVLLVIHEVVGSVLAVVLSQSHMLIRDNFRRVNFGNQVIPSHSLFFCFFPLFISPLRNGVTHFVIRFTLICRSTFVNSGGEGENLGADVRNRIADSFFDHFFGLEHFQVQGGQEVLSPVKNHFVDFVRKVAGHPLVPDEDHD